MLIGVLSDSHGRADTTARAVQALLNGGAQMLIHLGDFEAEAVIDELVGHNARIVFGNCDWDEQALAHYAELVGVRVDHPLGLAEVDGKRIAFTHGHLARVMQDAINDGVDYLFYGHTHTVSDERVGRTRLINPGALFRAPRYTAALLDPMADHLRIIEVPKGPTG